jgi:probable rRNA maturation factor
VSEQRVELACEIEAGSLDLALLRRQLEEATRLAGFTGVLSVALVDDARMAVLHETYLGTPEPTDVLSFPLAEPTATLPEGAATGEVVISLETAARSASERGAALAVELLLYGVHGILHLTGLDDQDLAGRRRMEAEERRILEALGHRRP